MAWWVYPAILGGTWLWREYVRPELYPEEGPKPEGQLTLPRTEEGAPIPLIYGQCRVRSPILSWVGGVSAHGNPEFGSLADQANWRGAPFLYGMHCHMILGVPFTWLSNNRLHKMFWGSRELLVNTSNSTIGQSTVSSLAQLTGNGSETGHRVIVNNTAAASGPMAQTPLDGMPRVGGPVEFLNGRPDQNLVNTTFPFASPTYAGRVMAEAGVTVAEIPGYRGVMSVFLGNKIDGYADGYPGPFIVGASPQPGEYSFEVSSHPQNSFSNAGPYIGLDANPVDVIYDLLAGKLGKLGITWSDIDTASFQSAATRLSEEGHGYSRALEEARDAPEVVGEILEQINGVVYETPTDAKIKIKLIRDDYAVPDLPHITEANCRTLEAFAIAGWASVVNKVRVTFTDRARNYEQGSAIAYNQAVGTVDDGRLRELVIDYPGVCTQDLANKLAGRELAARSRPLAKCKAIVSREFYAVCPGDAIKLTWPKYAIDGRVFRVVAVDRGSLENGAIALDLIEDYFAVYRQTLVSDWEVNGFPGDLEPYIAGAPYVAPGGGYPGGGSLSDGDKGDVTVSGSGSTWTIDAGAVTTSKLANDAVTFAKMQNIATQRLLGRATAGTGDVEELTGTAATALLDLFTSGAKGLVPASGGGTTTYLRADGSFAVPPGTGVTSGGLPYMFAPDHDGAVTFDGAATVLGFVPASNVYTLTRDIFCTNVTVNASVTVKASGCRIFCSGTLTNNGIIDDSGNDAVHSTAGTGRGNTNVLHGGSGGAAGPNAANGGAGSSAANGVLFPGGASSSAALGGAVATAGAAGDTLFRGGGGGGANATRTGGSGGPRTNQAAGFGGPSLNVLMRGYPDNPTGNKVNFATGGGAGGGPAVGSGGGGGGGGGWIFCFARIITGSGVFKATGGNGGNGNGNGTGTGGGGGGGGGGGLIVLAYGTRAGSWTTNVAGGTGGAGNSGGGAGGTGASGLAVLMNLSGDGT